MNATNQSKCHRLLGSGLWLVLLLGLAQMAQAAVYFPGEFAPGADWSAAPDQGIVQFSSANTGIVITGPGGVPNGQVKSSFDVMNYVGPSGTGTTAGYTISFHYRLDPGNSLNAAATFTLNGTTVVLGNTHYGGAAVEGDYTAVVPQYGTFAFGLDSQIYKYTAATLTITALRPIPEPSAYWAGGIMGLGFGWRCWRRRKIGALKTS